MAATELSTALKGIGALDADEARVAKTFLHPTEEDAIPGASSSSLRALCDALQNTPTRTAIAAKSLRATSAVIFSTAIEGNSRTLPLAAMAYVVLLRHAPRAYDHMIFETLVHKVVRWFATPAGASAKARGVRKRKRGNDGPERISASDVLKSEDPVETDDSVGDAADNIPNEKDFADFWVQYVKLLQHSSVVFEQSAVTRPAAFGLAGLLRHARTPAQRDLALKGTRAMLQRTGSKRAHDTIRALYAAFLPLVLTAKLPVATRTTLTSVLSSIAQADEAEVESNADGTLNRTSCDASEADSSAEPEADGPENDEGEPNFAQSPACQQGRALSKSTSIAFLQTCCMRPLDRAEDRAAVTDILLHLLGGFDEENVDHFCKSLAKLSRQPRALVRVFAIETIIALLNSASISLREPMCEVLVDSVLQRASDIAAACRSKALGGIAAYLEHSNTTKALVDTTQVIRTVLGQEFDLHARVEDPKFAVRKNAVQLLRALVSCVIGGVRNRDSGDGAIFGDSFSAKPLLAALRGRCEDALPSIRKAAVDVLTRLVLTLRNESETLRSVAVGALQETSMLAWIEAVLPRVSDADSSVQDACLDAFDTVVLSFLARRFSTKKNDPPSMCWSVSLVLREMQGGNSAAGHYASSAMRMLTRKSRVEPDVSRHLEYIATWHASQPSEAVTNKHVLEGSGAWALLAEIVSSDRTGKLRCVLDASRALDYATHGSACRSACRVASRIVDNVSAPERKRFAVQLNASISRMIEHPSDDASGDIAGMVFLLAAVDPDAGDDLLELCESAIFKEQQDRNTRLCAALVVAGEVSVCFGLTQEPSPKLVNSIQALVSTPSSSAVRALAMATLGKLCLGKPIRSAAQARKRTSFGESLARKNVSIFVHELSEGSCAASRVNALIILGDFCRGFTAIVEPYVDRLAMSLRDESPTVRKRAFATITSLLQEDYLKLRGGPIYFRIVAALRDSELELRRSAEYVLSKVLLAKTPALFVTNFVETFFVLNNFKNHPKYNSHIRSKSENVLDKALATDSRARMDIYRWLLSHMPIDQRLHLSARIRRDILSPVVNKQALDLQEDCATALLCDAFAVLAAPEVRLAPRAGASNEVDGKGLEDDESDASARDKLLSKVSFMELKEDTLPLLTELKRMLERLRSPALESLRSALCELLRPYKCDLQTLVQDSTLRAEVEYDLGGGSAIRVRKGDWPTKKTDGRAQNPLRNMSNIMSTPSPRLIRSGVRASTVLETPRQSSGEPLNTNCRLEQALAASPKLATLANSQRRCPEVEPKIIDASAGEDLGSLARRLEM